MNECILVVDDDREIVKAIAIALEKEGYRVLRAYDGMEALDILAGGHVQLLIIDVMMPRLDGLSAVMRIREKRNLPIIVLSAKSEDSDKILGLSMGADDYVTKPYNPQELAARVKSQLRRYTSLGDIHASEQTEELTNGRLLFRTDERILYADGEAVKLTATETKIMELFMRNLGRVFPAEEIYRRVWEEDAFAPENTVMVHIRRIREKIELNPKEPEYVKVVWGIGYKMEKNKRGIGAVTFFLGITLLLGDILQVTGMIAGGITVADIRDSMQSDYQKTSSFRFYMEGYLEDFLSMASGGEVGFSWNNNSRTRGISYSSYYGQESYGYAGDGNVMVLGSKAMRGTRPLLL